MTVFIALNIFFDMFCVLITLVQKKKAQLISMKIKRYGAWDKKLIIILILIEIDAH